MINSRLTTRLTTRRNALANILFGTSGLGLRALATGLPTAFLARPLTAQAEELMCTADKARAQFLILSTSGAGDPFNANAPGMYGLTGPAHAASPVMQKTELSLGPVRTSAAKVFSTLPQWALDRATFIHHSTLTNNHADHDKVLRLMGAASRGEMVPSLCAKALYTCLGTVQPEPVSIGAGNNFSYEGRALPDLKPRALKDLLATDDSVLTKLESLRDKSVDEMSALLKTRGTMAQQRHMDSLVTSRRQARSLSDDLLQLLASIDSDGPSGQVTAALALIRMKVSPVMYVRFSFGGDNHEDPDLGKEVASHVDSLGHIATLLEALKTSGLQDQVTFGVQNVFGRTLAKKGVRGRDHYGAHQVTMLIGNNVRPGVVGGLVPNKLGTDFIAGAFDATTGALSDAGDVAPDASLGAVGKTMGSALGVNGAYLDEKINRGAIIKAALKS